MSAQSDATDRALSLVTCASVNDAPAAAAVLAGLPVEQLQRVALHLSGMCWTGFERLGTWSGMDPHELFRMFAAGCQSQQPGG